MKSSKKTSSGVRASPVHCLSNFPYLPVPVSKSEYTRMANAIADLAKSSGKPPILFSLCQWGRVRICVPVSMFGYFAYSLVVLDRKSRGCGLGSLARAGG
jgi:hypothetical protein